MFFCAIWMFEAVGRSDSFLNPVKSPIRRGKGWKQRDGQREPRWEQKRRLFRQDGDWGLVGAVLAGFCRLLCVTCESCLHHSGHSGTPALHSSTPPFTLPACCFFPSPFTEISGLTGPTTRGACRVQGGKVFFPRPDHLGPLLKDSDTNYSPWVRLQKFQEEPFSSLSLLHPRCSPFKHTSRSRPDTETESESVTMEASPSRTRPGGLMLPSPVDSVESLASSSSGSPAVDDVGEPGRSGNVMITLSLTPDPPTSAPSRPPLPRSHMRSRSLADDPGIPAMIRAH